MAYRFILTPYFLDCRDDGLRPLAESGWLVNAPRRLRGSSTEERVASLLEPLAAEVASAIDSGDKPVSVAGDCLSAIGVTAGLQRAGVKHTLIWFDAHGDFNTWDTTPSGFLGGFPLAMLVGRGDQTILQRLHMDPLSEKAVIITDARDLDPGEDRALRASDIRHLKNVADLERHRLPRRAIHVHFDTDIVDPAEVPAMNYPSPGGPSSQVVRGVFEHLAETQEIAAVSLSSWNPALDSDGQSRIISMDLLHALLPEETR